MVSLRKFFLFLFFTSDVNRYRGTAESSTGERAENELASSALILGFSLQPSRKSSRMKISPIRVATTLGIAGAPGFPESSETGLRELRNRSPFTPERGLPSAVFQPSSACRVAGPVCLAADHAYRGDDHASPVGDHASSRSG